MRSLNPLILLHFTQFSDLAFCIPEGRQAHTGARHTSTTNIPCALRPEPATNSRIPLTKGVSVLRTETDHSFSLAGRAGQQRIPLLAQSRVLRVAASTAARPLNLDMRPAYCPLTSLPRPSRSGRCHRGARNRGG